jgi:hypothetical protein
MERRRMFRGFKETSLMDLLELLILHCPLNENLGKKDLNGKLFGRQHLVLKKLLKKIFRNTIMHE